MGDGGLFGDGLLETFIAVQASFRALFFKRQTEPRGGTDSM